MSKHPKLSNFMKKRLAPFITFKNETSSSDIPVGSPPGEGLVVDDSMTGVPSLRTVGDTLRQEGVQFCFLELPNMSLEKQ